MKMRPEVIHELFVAGQVREFRDIFGMWAFSKTTLAKAIGINNSLISEMIEDPSKLQPFHLQRIADYFKVTRHEIETVVNNQLAQDRFNHYR